VVCPHGVISFAGICSGIVGDDFGLGLRQEVLNRFPTAVASVVIQFPIMKHVIGIFGLLDASKKSLTKHIKAGKSFVLYPGGIAELFLSSPKEVSALSLSLVKDTCVIHSSTLSALSLSLPLLFIPSCAYLSMDSSGNDFGSQGLHQVGIDHWSRCHPPLFVR
jgi:hypothetical protein